MVRLGFIGTGKMGSALLKSINATGLSESITASDNNTESLSIIEKLGVKTTQDNNEVVTNSDIIFLCVKPQHIGDVLDGIKESTTSNHIIISIAAGIKINFIESKTNAKVVRVMPNTPCLVGEMAAGYSFGSKITDEDAKFIDKLLNSAGNAFKVDEEKLDAVTALSGSGPAFFAEFIGSIAKAAEDEGLDSDIAFKLACQTAKGTGKLLIEKNSAPDELIKMVASPGGTTEKGLEVLSKHDFKKILTETIKATAERSRELGKINDVANRAKI